MENTTITIQTNTPAARWLNTVYMVIVSSVLTIDERREHFQSTKETCRGVEKLGCGKHFRNGPLGRLSGSARTLCQPCKDILLKEIVNINNKDKRQDAFCCCLAECFLLTGKKRHTDRASLDTLTRLLQQTSQSVSCSSLRNSFSLLVC